jgi:very-short-patch-repair endonuclease
MTDAERLLWAHLRRRQIFNCKFRRQYPLGQYIVDFVCLERRLVVELDGGQHAEQQRYDAGRTRWLEEQGYQVLRFWNNQVFDELEGVLKVIANSLG